MDFTPQENFQSSQIVGACGSSKKFKYDVKEIDRLTNRVFRASQISNNEQYLAYEFQSRILKIYDLKKEKVCQEIKHDHTIITCQFTFDSSHLYIGCNNGLVYGYHCIRRFGKVFKKQIHNSEIYIIRTIKNQHLITCSFDNEIIKTNVLTKQQVFKFISSSFQIFSIDYDYLNDLIVIGSQNGSIRLKNCMNRTIVIDQAESHQYYINQIQLINDNTQLLSLDASNNLYKWKIDRQMKVLLKIQEIQHTNDVFSFNYVDQDQSLLLICYSCFQILNQQGECIYMFKAKEGNYESMCFIRQLYNIKYIQLKRVTGTEANYTSFIELGTLVMLD